MEQFLIKGKKMFIRMPEELDHFSSQKIREEADHLIAKRYINQVVFDFRDTVFMDSSGIGVIMGRYQNVRLLGGNVSATHVTDRIYRILQLAGMEKVIKIEREQGWGQ